MTSVGPQSHLYGKMPAHGDFISRGLGSSQDRTIDACLTASMEQAKQNWASDFEETYSSAQPWLFASQEATAIIIPSVDKVGRKFPLYFAVLKGLVLQFVYDKVITAISESQAADILIGAIEGAPVRDKSHEAEPDRRWFCIDPTAPCLPLCWNETSLTLNKSAHSESGKVT